MIETIINYISGIMFIVCLGYWFYIGRKFQKELNKLENDGFVRSDLDESENERGEEKV